MWTTGVIAKLFEQLAQPPLSDRIVVQNPGKRAAAQLCRQNPPKSGAGSA